MGSRDPSQSVGPSNTSPLAVPEAELINQAVEEAEVVEEVAEANQQLDNKSQDKLPQPHLAQNP